MNNKMQSPHFSARAAQLSRRASVLLLSMVLAGCAASPEKLCASLVLGTWQYIGPDAGLTTLLEASLPRAPYTTNEGKLVRSVRHVWYRDGDHLLAACTLARNARNDCSVKVTDFILAGNTWSKRGEDEVLCNVLAQNAPQKYAPGK